MSTRVCREDVPSYLQRSKLYQSLPADDNNQFELPSAFFKGNTCVNSVADLEHLLETLRYWMSDEQPPELIAFCVKCTDTNTITNLLKKYCDGLDQFQNLLSVVSEPRTDMRLYMAVSRGSLHILEALHDTAPPQLVNFAKPIDIVDIYGRADYNLCVVAALHGHVNCMQYLHLHGCPLIAEVCKTAAEFGHLACLRYARSNGCMWDSDTCCYAAMNGHLECLEYAHENGCPWDKDTCSYAAEYGHVECLIYASSQGCPWDERTCMYAAKKGHLKCLEYAHSHGCAWDEDTCSYAAQNGHLECLIYAHSNGCPWDQYTCINAERNGHEACLGYARSNGCPT